MPKSKSKKIPHFRYLDELVEFFDTRDLGEYWNETAEAHFDVDLKRRTHLVAIDSELASELSQIARSKQTSSQRLINSWLKEKILEQQEKNI